MVDSECDLKMEVIDSSETFVTTYETTRYLNPEGENLNVLIITVPYAIEIHPILH